MGEGYWCSVEAADVVMGEMVSTPPTTAAGAAALVRTYLDKCDPDVDGPKTIVLFETLYDFLQSAA
jgi:hypothetical protein